MKIFRVSFLRIILGVAILVISAGFFFNQVVVVYAGAGEPGPAAANDSDAGAGGANGGAAGVVPSVELMNPLKNINSIGDLLEAILHIIMILMIPIIVFYIIYSGFKYVTALGNASQVEEASQSLLYAVIGGVLILGSLAIVEIIKNVVAQF